MLLDLLSADHPTRLALSHWRKETSIGSWFTCKETMFTVFGYWTTAILFFPLLVFFFLCRDSADVRLHGINSIDCKKLGSIFCTYVKYPCAFLMCAFRWFFAFFGHCFVRFRFDYSSYKVRMQDEESEINNRWKGKQNVNIDNWILQQLPLKNSFSWWKIVLQYHFPKINMTNQFFKI